MSPKFGKLTRNLSLIQILAPSLSNNNEGGWGSQFIEHFQGWKVLFNAFDINIHQRMFFSSLCAFNQLNIRSVSSLKFLWHRNRLDFWYILQGLPLECLSSLKTLSSIFIQKFHLHTYSGVPNKHAARLLILKEIFPPTWPY